MAMLSYGDFASLLRILLAPLVVYSLLRECFLESGVLLALGALSDYGDGWLARRYGGSPLGKALDPLADKIFIGAFLWACYAKGWIPGWFFYLLIARDVVILLGASYWWWAKGFGSQDHPSYLSKVNTALAMAFFGVILMAHFYKWPGYLLAIGYGIIGLTTLASWGHYGFIFFRNLYPSKPTDEHLKEDAHDPMANKS